eukprot:2733854-Rhodomonas_salina.1
MDEPARTLAERIRRILATGLSDENSDLMRVTRENLRSLPGAVEMADQIMSERFADTVQQTLVRVTYEDGMTTQSREILLGVARELHVYW